MKLKLTAALLIAFATITFAQPPNLKEETIHIGPGTEDLVLDTLNGQQRLLVSCSQRRKGLPMFGEIVSLSLKDNSKDTLVRTGEPADLSFHPHGIDLVKGNNGAALLFVVNHEETEAGKKNSILLYEVKGSTLVFMRQQTDKTIVSPNDVAGLPDGSFYATNDSKRARMGFGWLMEKLFKIRTSQIVYCNGAGQCINANDKKLAYANGILIVNDLVYIATTQRKTLAEYRRQTDGTLLYSRNVAKLNGLDNISQVNSDHVIIAAHPKAGKFLKHAKNSQNPSPGIVYLIKLDNGKTEELFANDGSKISGNSVAVAFGNSFYIGQVFEDWILKVTIPLPKEN